MNEFKKTLLDLLIRLKLDHYSDEEYRKEIVYLEQVLKNDKYIFMPIEKLSNAIITSEDHPFNKYLAKRRIRLTFTAEIQVAKEEIYKANLWKEVDEYLAKMLKEGLEQDS